MPNSFSDYAKNTKIILDIIKILLESLSLTVIAILFGFLLFNPKSLRSWCERGGFAECNVFGQKLTPEQKDKIQTQESVGGEVRASIQEVLKEKEGLSEAQVDILRNAETKLSSSLSQLTPLVDKVASEGDWAIVFGGDVSYQSARDEISKANNIGYDQAQIYFREGSYRSVIPFGSRETAKSALSEVRELSFNKDAYLVNLTNWCSDPVLNRDQTQKYYECK